MRSCHPPEKLTTTAQLPHKMPEKPVVITNNGLFRYVTIAVQIQQNSRFNASLCHPVVVLRPGRPEVRILPVAPKRHDVSASCLFSLPVSSRRGAQRACLRALRADGQVQRAVFPSAAPTSSPVSARTSAASATPKPDHKAEPKPTPAPTSTAQPAAPTQSPRTGDNASLMTWVGILLVCGTALAGLYVYKKRKQK